MLGQEEELRSLDPGIVPNGCLRHNPRRIIDDRLVGLEDLGDARIDSHWRNTQELFCMY